MSGLAVAYLLDWQVAITGQELTTEDHKVWATRYGDGINQSSNTWGSLREVTGAAAASDVSFWAPSVGYLDVWRLFFLEVYAGDVAYERQQWTTMDLSSDFNEEQWREPVAFDYEGAGLAVSFGAGTQWLTVPDGVWLTALPAHAELDVSADVVEASVSVDPQGSIVELELDNVGGGYTAYGSGDLGALQRGSRLQLTPGYRTPAGSEAPLPYTYWIESVELVTGARPRLRLRARDGWWLLSTWRARRQFVWAAGDKTVSQLLLFVAARAGVQTSASSPSSAFTTLEPAFTIHAGESGVTAVRRLLAMVEDLARWDGDTLEVVGHADDDSPGYELGPGEHSVTEAVYRDVGPAVNRARVIGLGVSADVIDDFGETERAERIAQVIDVNLDAGAEATARAEAVLRKAAIGALEDQVTLFGVHCGVELWDVVELTDGQAGLSAAPRRVSGYAWRFDTQRGRHGMELTLGAV